MSPFSASSSLKRVAVGSLMLIIAALLFSRCNIQNSLLYYPEEYFPDETFLKAHNIRPWPSPPKEYRGLVSLREVRQAEGTVIVFHGNAGTAADRVLYEKALGALGYRVILAEYPAYGGRKGKLGEKSFVNDGRETVRLASEQFGGPIFLLGESLGCGVAAAIARETSVKIGGVLLITPWDTLASVAQTKYPYVPVKLFLTDTYDSIGNLRSFMGRIAVVGAGRDEIIPIGHAHALFASLASPTKRMWMLKEAGHNDWSLFTNASWWKEIMNFVSGKDQE